MGDSAFTLTLTGTDIISGAMVLWNSAARPTTFISSTSVITTIPSSDLTMAGITVPVALKSPSPGELSAPPTLTVIFGAIYLLLIRK